MKGTPNFKPHPGALTNPDFYAQEMVEGRMTRRDVKRHSFLLVYGGSPSHMRDFVSSGTNFMVQASDLGQMDFAEIERRVLAGG